MPHPSFASFAKEGGDFDFPPRVSSVRARLRFPKSIRCKNWFSNLSPYSGIQPTNIFGPFRSFPSVRAYTRIPVVPPTPTRQDRNMIRKPVFITTLLLLWAASALAADTVLTWPPNGKDAIVRFTVGKLRQVSSASGQSDYLGEALAENLSAKPISSASFYLYLLDKSGKRVGEGYLEVTNLAAGQRAKIPVSVHTMGSYASMELQPQHLPSDEPFKVKMRITSVPSGATIKLDSQESGVTPQMLPIAPGKHVLEFSKEGFTNASTPVEVVANSMPGSVEIELNPMTLDTVVLRDGTTLVGDVASMTATAINLNVKGKPTKLDRTRVARIVLGQHKRSTTARRPQS